MSVPSSELGPPTPLPPQASVSPLLDPKGGGATPSASEGVGGGGSHVIRMTSMKACHSVYFVSKRIKQTILYASTSANTVKLATSRSDLLVFLFTSGFCLY